MGRLKFGRDKGCLAMARGLLFTPCRAHTLGKRIPVHLCLMDKRTFLKITGAAGAGLVLTPWMGCAPGEPEGQPQPTTTFGPETFTLPALGFEMDALAPSIDEATMEIHHGKHHAGYVRKLNAALDGVSVGPDGSLESLLAWVAPDNAALRKWDARGASRSWGVAVWWRIWAVVLHARPCRRVRALPAAVVPPPPPARHTARALRRLLRQ